MKLKNQKEKNLIDVVGNLLVGGHLWTFSIR